MDLVKIIIQIVSIQKYILIRLITSIVAKLCFIQYYIIKYSNTAMRQHNNIILK